MALEPAGVCCGRTMLHLVLPDGVDFHVDIHVSRDPKTLALVGVVTFPGGRVVALDAERIEMALTAMTRVGDVMTTLRVADMHAGEVQPRKMEAIS